MVECVAQKGVLGKAFKKAAKAIMEELGKLEDDALGLLEAELKDNGYMSTIVLARGASGCL